MTVRELFAVKYPIIAPVVLLPLPGSPAYAGNLTQIAEQAVADAQLLASLGVDGLSVENMGDAPFFKDEAPPETVASYGRMLAEIRRVTDLPLGVNVLRNCGRASLALAQAFDANYVRVNVLTETYVTDQGIIEGRAAELLRVRRLIDAQYISIFADVNVKHASPMRARGLRDAALDMIERGGADTLIVTGDRTGGAASRGDLQIVHEVAPVVIGSGLTASNAPSLLPASDGAIVATFFREGSDLKNPIAPARVRELMKVVEGLRRP